MRRSWLTMHVLADAAGAAAHADAAALGPTVHAALLAAGDRLAAISPGLAQRYYHRSALAWDVFGADGFARWVALGEEIAAACREGALAWFGLAPVRLVPLAAAADWCALGLRVARTSRRLAAAYFERTVELVGGLERLAAWVDAGLTLHDSPGWRSAVLAQAYFDSGFPHGTDQYISAAATNWAAMALALAGRTRSTS